jgi:redox-sensitive bicupin YhaK (pirin superfamily)
MMAVRKSDQRGKANFGWLDSKHTFSFGQYFDPKHMGFGPLRVINEDRVQPGKGFATHGHQDMEILTYVLEGALEHKDSLGNGSIIKPGDVQRMTAGTGVRHSEYNASATDQVHFLQIWIQPEAKGLRPGYEQTSFDRDSRHNQLRLVASRDGREGSVTVHQDVDLYAGLLDAGAEVRLEGASQRQRWLHVARGELQLGELALSAGDGVAMADVEQQTLTALTDAEVLLFDMGA